MALNDPVLSIGATSIRNAITHFQLHSAAPGAAGATAAVGARVANTGAVNATADITWSTLAFTGLAANQGVTHVSYWSALTAGTFYGSSALTGDLSANSAGEFNITSIVENGSGV